MDIEAASWRDAAHCYACRAVDLDVARTGVRRQYVDGEGEPLADGRGSPTYLWHRAEAS